MKKVLAKILMFVFISGLFGSLPGYGFRDANYDLIYEDMPILDFMYETGVDPEEAEDYEKYVVSPYVLVRLPVKLRNQKILLNRGYYLVKPEKKDGYNFAIFKQNGRVVGAVPIYKKYLVNPAEIFPEPQKPDPKWYAKPFVAVWNIIKWPYNYIMEHRNPPKPSRAKAEFNLVEDGKYYDMGLYVEDRLYKMLFKLEK